MWQLALIITLGSSCSNHICFLPSHCRNLCPLGPGKLIPPSPVQLLIQSFQPLVLMVASLCPGSSPPASVMYLFTNLNLGRLVSVCLEITEAWHLHCNACRWDGTQASACLHAMLSHVSQSVVPHLISYLEGHWPVAVPLLTGKPSTALPLRCVALCGIWEVFLSTPVQCC